MAGEGSFKVQMSGDGDADLYVRKGAQPTKSEYDCRPFTAGSNDDCDVAGPGEFYVSVWGFQASNFTLKVIYTKPGSDSTPTGNADHISATGSVTEGGMEYYEIEVKAGQKIVVRTECSTDVDLYARMNLVPTEALYDYRSYRYTGNEILEITPETDGTLHIAVHGYEAGDFTITTADE